MKLLPEEGQGWGNLKTVISICDMKGQREIMGGGLREERKEKRGMRLSPGDVLKAI